MSPTSPADATSGTGPAPLTADIAGTWTLRAMAPAGRPEQTSPASAVYTLSLAEGRLSTRVDCNTCAGTFSISGETLSAGPALACTRAACPTMVFEHEYTRLLSGDSSVTLDGGTLVLSSPRGVLRFSR